MTSTLTRPKGRRHAEHLAELHAAGVRFPVDAKRGVRRALSRDVSRAMAGPNLRQPSHGMFADLVNARVPMPVRPPSRRSGQARINAKRNERAEFWRTVKVHVHPDIEQPFREHLHLLGDGARIHGRTLLEYAFVVELDVHVPGAPARAHRAEPVYRSVLRGGRYVPELDYVVFYDADGQVIDIENDRVAEVSA